MIEPTADPARAGFRDFAELSGAHARRLARKRGDASPRGRDGDPEPAELFADRVRETGRVLSDPAERERAQDIIDFWLPEVMAEVGAGRAPAQLVPFATADEGGQDPERARAAPRSDAPSLPLEASANARASHDLVPPAAGASPGLLGSIIAAGTSAAGPLMAGFVPVGGPGGLIGALLRQPSPRQSEPAGDLASLSRERGRVVAIARQWRDSGKRDGYLLYGRALEDAEAFTDDPDVLALVRASRRAVKRRKTRWTAFAVFLGLGLIGGIVFLLDRNARLTTALQSLGIQKAAADAEAEQLAEAVRLIRREVDAQRIAPSSLPPSLKQQVEDDTPDRASVRPDRDAAPSSSPEGDPVRSDGGPSRTAGDDLASKVGLLDAPTPVDRTATAQALVSALRDGTLPEPQQRPVAEALARMAGDATLPDLTETGRYNLLFVLSEVPRSSWARPGWLDLKATMRRAIADFDRRLADGSVKAGPDARRFLSTLKGRLGPDPAQGRTVYLQFAGMTRDAAVAISSDLKALGWTVPGEERTAAAARQNEIRYGDPGDKEAAEMLAADLRAAGQTRVKSALRNPDIKSKVLEAWVSR